MGLGFLLHELEVGSYSCGLCHNSDALADGVLSRTFNCSQGRAFLFSNVVNVTSGPKGERLMLSGKHIVEDIFWCCCGQILGWKYVTSHDKYQKYKEGKFVLERWRIVEMMEVLNGEAYPGSTVMENS